MTEEKQLDPVVADKIGVFVNLKGSVELLETLKSNPALSTNPSAQAGIEDMTLLFNYLRVFDVLPRVSFDLSLARGLDYYTGVIYEVVTEGSAPPASKHKTPKPTPPSDQPTSTRPPKDPDADRSSDPTLGVGSVAAGGRYDSLVGMFSGKSQIPCVGISFGVDRIFSITKARAAASKTAAPVRASEVDVYVMAFGGKGFTGLLEQRMEVARVLWDAGIKAEFSYKAKPKLPAQFKAAEAGGVPLAVILGEEEMEKGVVKIKEMGLPEGHAEKDGVMVEMGKLVETVRARLEGLKERERGLVEGVKSLDVKEKEVVG